MSDIVRDPYGNPLNRDKLITALRAENEKLRAALKAISEVKPSWGSESEEMYGLARAALEEKQ